MAVKQHKVIRDSSDNVCLKVIIRVLESIEQKQCLVGTERSKMCEKIVSKLGTITTPPSPEEYAKFMIEVAKIQEVLTKAIADEEMIIATLNALYNEISNPQKNPAPMMSIVLQLIELQHIPKAVQWILGGKYQEASLEQALLTLCKWLSKWTLTPNLGPLVLEFMRGLEMQQHYDILIEVTVIHIEKLFQLVIIPDIRRSLGPVVIHMLSSMQHSPEAFHKIIPHVDSVLKSLHREDSESSHSYLQNLVNLCMELMDHFPSDPVYDQLRQTLQPFSSIMVYKQSLGNCKSWMDGANPPVPMQCKIGKVGLNNLGNTCYMNSVLQALFMTKPFRNDLLLNSGESVPLFVKLQELFALLQFSERLSLSPSDVSSVARPPAFQPGHQHDSSEFLGYLLDMLHEQLSSSGAGSTASGAQSEKCNTAVKNAFGGMTQSLSQCSNCRSTSVRMDTFRELQLSFPQNTDNQSVQTLIDYYLQPEKLCGDNQYHCETCSGLTDGERDTKVIEAPPRLVLTLKHFRYDPATQLRTKILQRVRLDKDIILANSPYRLYAAVVHCGSSVDSGHYYTYARDGLDWYKFNDCFVTKSKGDELHGLNPPEAPYILFYSRVDCEDPPEVNKSDLSERLQSVLLKDGADFDAERKRSQINYTRNRQNRNNDDQPPGCGGGGGGMWPYNPSHNQYVCK